MSPRSYAETVRLRRRAAGFTQRELAHQAGVKQPLIAAIERGVRQPSDTVRAALDEALQLRPSELLSVVRADVLDAAARVGATDVRVFGSVALGTDEPGSDLDLLVAFPPDADIVTLLGLEEHLTDLLTVPVDVVSAGSSGPVLARALAEAVPL
ncbi:MAG: helix-turn-helix domain-containing protein [Propionibacteriaceae bacterium]|nr:XRE family transcriptional regulator [Micropruina sp.]HBX81213.1 Cro/Cl family transcriptional regulator [Propionibacteriaceae bacterium]HBY22354.1 Cro/Cl family transcriptional regulator [Propionibacteriaceae bacterium]